MAEQVILTGSGPRQPQRLAGCQVTNQHRRFVSFADAVRRHRSIGACSGAPGLGVTLSARTYAAADDWDQWLTDRWTRGTALPEAAPEPHHPVHARCQHHRPTPRPRDRFA
jgi:hypothetical protein